MTNALIYVRQSRHKESERTVSPEVQEASCRALPISNVRERSFGKPASRNTCSMASAQPGTFEESFITVPLPAIMPGDANRKTYKNGKFHGITASTTPSGWKMTKLLLASVLIGSGARKRSALSA